MSDFPRCRILLDIVYAVFYWFMAISSLPTVLIIIGAIRLFPWTYGDPVFVLDECEDAILLGSGIRPRVFHVLNSEIRVLEKKTSKNPSSAQSIFLIHGVFGSAVGFEDLIEAFSADYHVYAIDLPGFGRSTGMNANGETVLDYYLKVIAAVITEVGVEMPIVLGHSYGAYIAIKFARKYPIGCLVIYNPVGIFPTLGEYGAYYALKFQIGWRLVGIYGTGGVPILSPRFFSPRFRYWYYLMANPKAWGASMVSNYIDLGFMCASWKYPAYHDLGKLKCRVLGIYSADDPMVQLHEGLTIKKNLDIPLEIIPFVDHEIVVGYSSKLLAREIASHLRTIGSPPLKTNPNFDFSEYKSSFFSDNTLYTIRDMYLDLKVSMAIRPVDDGSV